MFPIVRPRSMILLGAAAVVVGIAALGGTLLLVGQDAEGKDLNDPDPQAVSTVSVCSDVKVHAWVTMNVGTVAEPDNKNVDYDIDATRHDHDPFGLTLAKGCNSAAGAFGSRVELKAPGLNKGRPLYVTAPADGKHVLVLRLTRHADGTVTSTQQLVAAR
ncbi:hypothetical protein JHN63_32835 [Streptomyces sp. MBT65]|uniref:hypothetical protein n=1 Tax=Streptomyces sp. MBT65 TaxID=1488395 RepID=UPI00190B7A54|nr:hypothetical protein [Streptomyces sp. MBT65]MBK3578506.1 hypothetical protein [Streptomyces sp. MBT65]